MPLRHADHGTCCCATRAAQARTILHSMFTIIRFTGRAMQDCIGSACRKLQLAVGVQEQLEQNKPKTLQNELRLSSVTWAGQACKSLPARVPVPGQQRASTNSCCFASLPKPAWQVMFAISSLSLSLRVRLDGRAWPVLFGAAIPRHRQFLGGLVKPDEHCKKV